MGRKTTNSDSLELFLDTICNTFGGILFILLFVILMLKGTEKSYTEAHIRQIDTEDIEELSRQVDDISYDLEEIRDRFSDTVSELESVNLETKEEVLQALNKDTSQRNQLNEEQAKLEEQLRVIQDELQQNNDPPKEARSNLLEQISYLQKAVEEAKTQAQIAKTPERRDQSMPQLKETSTYAFDMVLCFGRLYSLHNRSSDGKLSRPLNTDDFVVVESSSNDCHVSPKPWCGIDLADLTNAKSEIKMMLNHFSNKDYRITLFVCDDSFSYFGSVVSILKDLGYLIEPAYFSEILDYAIYDRGGTGRAKAQ